MKKLVGFIKPIYGKAAGRIRKTLEAHAKTIEKVPPVADNRYWYKSLNLYFIYPDGIVYNKRKKPLQNIIPHIKHVKELGCNALHILPFLESPMIDRGFDISDFYTVRQNLGTLQDIKEIKKEADKHGIRLCMDLVLNHVSDQHEWFKKAENGDEKYREYFLYTKTQPEYIKTIRKESAVWAQYKIDGAVRDINIAFPEHVGEIPHFREGKDGYWYYHTYYPQQLDLNWNNPDVFIEMGKVLLYWGSLGFNFRLDAIPFVGKKMYKATDSNNDNTHNILAELKRVIEQVNPECSFVVETFEKMQTVIDYFGTSNKPEANLSYNFHLCSNLWVSIIKQDATFIWNQLQELNNIPKHAEWMNFLRNHDELSLAHLPENLVRDMNHAVLKYGSPFREEYGIAGRTYSLLEGNQKKFLMAYFLLASFPGGMIIPYGDELGYKNIPQKDLTEQQKKDTRNINRGVIKARQLKSPKAKRIYTAMSQILAKRQQLRDYLNVWPENLNINKRIFSAKYTLGSSELIILVNLSEHTRTVDVTTEGLQCIASINNAKLIDKQVILEQHAGIWLQK